MENIENISWYQKYKPKNIDEYIFENDDQKEKTQKWLEDGYLPGHLLLYGPPGTGKTALAELLINNVINNREDVKKVRSRSVEEIDNLYYWCQKRPLESQKKIVFLEEFDKLSKQAVTTLKDTMLEKFQNEVSFIATTNFINVLDEALVSRFNFRFGFSGSNKEGIYERIKTILNSENVNYEDEELWSFINRNHRMGLRNIITKMQVNVSNTGNIDFNEIESGNQHLEEVVSNRTLDLYKYLLSSEVDPSKKKMALVNPVNSEVANSYLEILDIINYSNDLNYLGIFDILDRNTSFVPIKKHISNYLETLDRKKYPNIHYVSFLYDSMRSILEINI